MLELTLLLTIISHADFLALLKATELTLSSRCSDYNTILVAQALVLGVFSVDAAQKEFLRVFQKTKNNNLHPIVGASNLSAKIGKLRPLTLHASQVTAPQCQPLDGSPQTRHGSNLSSANNAKLLLFSSLMASKRDQTSCPLAERH